MTPLKPRFRADLVARPVHEGGRRTIQILDRATGARLSFSDLGYSIAFLMNGERDLSELAVRIRDDLGVHISLDKLQSLVDRLDRLACLEAAPAMADDRRPKSRYEKKSTVAMPVSMLMRQLDQAPRPGGKSVRRQAPASVASTPDIDSMVTSLASPKQKQNALAAAPEPSANTTSLRPAAPRLPALAAAADDSLVQTLCAGPNLPRPEDARPKVSGSASDRAPERTPAPLANRPLPMHVAAQRRARNPNRSDSPRQPVVMMVPDIDQRSPAAHPRSAKTHRNSLPYSSGNTSVVYGGQFESPVSPTTMWLAWFGFAAASLWASWAVLRLL